MRKCLASIGAAITLTSSILICAFETEGNDYRLNSADYSFRDGLAGRRSGALLSALFDPTRTEMNDPGAEKQKTHPSQDEIAHRGLKRSASDTVSVAAPILDEFF